MNFSRPRQEKCKIFKLILKLEKTQKKNDPISKIDNVQDNDDNKKILREVKQSGEIHIVLDCDLDKIRTVMKEAQVGCGGPLICYQLVRLILKVQKFYIF